MLLKSQILENRFLENAIEGHEEPFHFRFDMQQQLRVRLIILTFE